MSSTPTISEIERKNDDNKCVYISLLEAELARLLAAVEVAENAHDLCIDELFDAQEEIKRLRAALFCEECGGRWEVVEHYHDSSGFKAERTRQCPSCGPIREALRGENDGA